MGELEPITILLMEDDPADRKLVRAYLQQIESREIVEKQTAPVVMLTGSGSEEVAVQSLQEGAVGYLPKSKLSTEKLVETIDDVLKRWRQIQQSRANQEELERLANIDSLTGLLNRGAILRKLSEQMKHAKRYREELSLNLLDIDHFKKVNDQHGHLTGDDVLEQVATLVQQNIRDAALIYLQEHKPQNAPSTDIVWQEEDVAPPGLVGALTKQFISDEWTAKVSYPVLPPENTVSGSGITQMKRRTSLLVLVKQCSSLGATNTTVPSATDFSFPPPLTIPLPDRTKTSCSHEWEWKGVELPGLISNTRITNVGAPSSAPMTTRRKTPGASSIASVSR